MEILKYVQKKNLGVIGGFLSKVDPGSISFFFKIYSFPVEPSSYFVVGEIPWNIDVLS
jgi:hypothetical protein